MVFGKLLKKRETLLGLDIGASTIKLAELERTASGFELANIGVGVTPADALQGNSVIRPDSLADAIVALLEENGISDRRVSLAMPSISVYPKKVKMDRMSMDDIASNIHLEAGGFLPQNINDVELDFHILGESGKQLDVLVVAVKKEILDGYLEALSLAGLEAAVADVDYFALQNCFELNYPELLDKTVALINIGTRYSSINICRRGESLYMGDISIGGRLFTDALMEQLSMTAEQAEQAKRAHPTRNDPESGIKEVIEKNVEYVAGEFNRQLRYFWGASGAEEGIDKIILSGGGSQIAGLKDEISESTGIESEYLNPLKVIEVPSGFDATYVKDISASVGVALGLAVREPGDKIIPEFME
jgi:type IV pilus assembly protein PilM